MGYGVEGFLNVQVYSVNLFAIIVKFTPNRPKHPAVVECNFTTKPILTIRKKLFAYIWFIILASLTDLSQILLGKQVKLTGL